MRRQPPAPLPKRQAPLRGGTLQKSRPGFPERPLNSYGITNYALAAASGDACW